MSKQPPKSIIVNGHRYLHVGAWEGEWQSDRPGEPMYAPPELYKGVQVRMLPDRVNMYYQVMTKLEHELKQKGTLSPKDQQTYERAVERLDKAVEKYKKERPY